MVYGNSTILNVQRIREGARAGIWIDSKPIVAAITAIALGSAILFVVGFSRGEFVHAAAHDVRHAAGFPCH